MNYRGLFTGETGTSLPASKPDFPRYFLNSFILSGMSTLLAIIIGVPAAYVLVRGKFKEESTRESIAFTLLSFWFGPIAIALPLYRIYQSIGLLDNYLGLILIYQLIGIPFVVWMSRSYFMDIPISVEEAALIDGASPGRLLGGLAYTLAKGDWRLRLFLLYFLLE